MVSTSDAKLILSQGVPRAFILPDPDQRHLTEVILTESAEVALTALHEELQHQVNKRNGSGETPLCAAISLRDHSLPLIKELVRCEFHLW